MTDSPPWSSGEQRALSLAWSIPVLLAVYIGLGYGLGGLLGSKLVGALVGWLAGMGSVFYEIRKLFQNKRRRADAR